MEDGNEHLFMLPDTEGLEKLKRWMEEGKVGPVVGMTAKLEDVEGMRKGYQQIYGGKSKIGKLVIEMDC